MWMIYGLTMVKTADDSRIYGIIWLLPKAIDIH